MMRFKSKLLSLNANKTIPTKVFSPANCEELRIPFRQDKVAKVVGQLANRVQMPTNSMITPPISEDDDDKENNNSKRTKINNVDQDMIISGVLVQNDFKLSLMAPEDLKEYAGLTTTTVMCKQRLTLAAAGTALIKWALEGTFGTVKELSSSPEDITPTEEIKSEDEHKVTNGQNRPTIFEIMSAVKVILKDAGEVSIEWEGNVNNDSIADAVISVLLTVESSPAAVKRKSKLYLHVYDILTDGQNLQNNTLTTITRIQTFLPKIVFLVCVCSWKHTLVKKQSHQFSRHEHHLSPRLRPTTEIQHKTTFLQKRNCRGYMP